MIPGYEFGVGRIQGVARSTPNFRPVATGAHWACYELIAIDEVGYVPMADHLLNGVVRGSLPAQRASALCQGGGVGE